MMFLDVTPETSVFVRGFELTLHSFYTVSFSRKVFLGPRPFLLPRRNGGVTGFSCGISSQFQPSSLDWTGVFPKHISFAKFGIVKPANFANTSAK
jgi:hypothetical protein